MNNDREVETLRHKLEELNDEIDKLERQNERFRKERNACRQGVRILRMDYQKLIDSGQIEREKLKEVVDKIMDDLDEFEKRIFGCTQG